MEQILTLTTTLVARIYTRMMKIVRFYKEKLRWDLEVICSMTKSARHSKRKAQCSLM
jgi:hypothetical protein